MKTDQLAQWAVANPWPTAVITTTVAILAGVASWRIERAIRTARRPPASVLVAAAGALVCTAYSGDTSWRFAEHRLDMADFTERAAMFAAAELALLACGVMARANKKATTTPDEAGTPGVPGVLMWLITGVLVIPCYSESGLVGGTVRAVIGPLMAGLLWHLAMGLEIKVVKPQALSTGLPAVIGRELRERLLSRLGLATRDRTAAQITRDRATARAVRLGARWWLGPWGRARLAAALSLSGAATHGGQRHTLMQELAGRRSAGQLRTVPVVSPWVQEPVPEAYPRTPLGVTGEQLRRMDPIEAILCVHRAHPAAPPAELAALCTEYGVPVTEAQAGLALRADRWGAGPIIEPTAPEPPALPAVPAEVPEPSPAETPVPQPANMPELPPEVRVPEPAPLTIQALVLDLPDAYPLPNPMAAAPPLVLAADQPRIEVHARVPAKGVPGPAADPISLVKRPAPEQPPATAPPAPSTAVPDVLLDRARDLDAEYGRTHPGRPASIRVLKRELHIGQPKAERLRATLDGEAAARCSSP